MGRKQEAFAKPNLAFLILSKVFGAKRGGVSLDDRMQYALQGELAPGEHRIAGSLDFDVGFTVGENTQANRPYGVPVDSILLLAFLYAGALRPAFLRAALIVREIRTAELEERPVQAIDFTYDDIVTEGAGYATAKKHIHVDAVDVAHEAVRLGLKLNGEWPAFTDDPNEAQYRTLMAEQISNCLASVKVLRPYDGPINLVDVELTCQQVPHAKAA